MTEQSATHWFERETMRTVEDGLRQMEQELAQIDVSEAIKRQVEQAVQQMEQKLTQIGASEAIEREVEQAVRQMEEKLAQIDISEAIEREVEQGLSGMDIRGLTRQMEEAIRRAGEEVQAALERWGGAPEAQAPPRREPVSDEERLAVLRMLENGIITTEEAEQLLDALEGRRSR